MTINFDQDKTGALLKDFTTALTGNAREGVWAVAQMTHRPGRKMFWRRPKKISQADLTGARRVVTFCLLPDGYPGEVKVENWDGVPPMNEDYGKARDWLVKRINRLPEELRSEK